MVLDQIFSHMEGPDSHLSYLHNSTEALNEMSMDLDDIKFDFDTISDNLGDWIDSPDCKVNNVDYSDILKSEPLNFNDVSITEAVKYDCMWSSNPNPSTLSQTTLSENNLLDDFLKMLDSSTSNFELDLDIKDEPVKPVSSCKQTDPLTCDRLQEKDSDVRMYTSLDHCYVSRGPSSPAGDKTTSYPMTPPESSEDEDSSCTSSRSGASSSSGYYSVSSSSQSLLKKMRYRSGSGSGGGEAKFCVKVKLSTDPSRSLLKQQKFHIIKNNTSKSPFSRPSSTSPPLSSSFAHDNNETSPVQVNSTRILHRAQIQNNMRRRKEESLRIKHEDAREIHNHMERQRRNELKVAFDELKACMPDIANSDKVSKQMILDTALHNCKLLKSKEVSLKLKRDRLKKSNAELLRKISALQERRAAVNNSTSSG